MQNEVIIDGCNVAECGFYLNHNDLNCACDMESSCKCKENHNCYFKQLQRVKAELEKYKTNLNCPNCNTPLTHIANQFYCKNCHVTSIRSINC